MTIFLEGVSHLSRWSGYRVEFPRGRVFEGVGVREGITVGFTRSAVNQRLLCGEDTLELPEPP